MLKAIING